MKTRDILRTNIRKLREANNMTQAMVAEKLNMSETGYAKIERGLSAPNPERLGQIANLFKVDISELYRTDEGVVVINSSNDNSTNSSNFHFSMGEVSNNDELSKLNQTLEIKNNLLKSREMEIEHLRIRINELSEHIETQKKYILTLENVNHRNI